MEAGERGNGRKCESEGSEPILDIRITKLLFDSERGKAGLNARRLLDGKFDKNKVEVIRPGQFMPGPIRESGLKHPLLIKGDRYNFNPHMGVSLTGTGPTATDLADRMDQEKEIETWEVSKQRPGPKWKLEQFFIYWHARQAHVAKQALEDGKQPTAAAGQYGNEKGGDDEDLQDDGNSADVLVLAAKDGDGGKQWHTAAVAQRGINQEQATKLFCGESISLEHANPNNQAANNKARDDKPPAGPLSDEIHPPPTINNIDLVRMLERHLRDLNPKPEEKPATSGAAAAAADKADGAAQPGASCERGLRGSNGVPDIGPARTMHLQMMPMGGFADFKTAPGGAATWLYVLSGRQVLVLLPPNAKNRSLYMSWAQASLAQTLESQVLDVFLADYAQDPMRVEVKQNEALLIPAGWFYASVAPQDCISVCCFFWHPYALGDIARTQHLQLHLKQRDTELSRKARALMWRAALHYTRSLRDKLNLPPYRAVRPGGSRHMTPSSSSGGSGMMGQQQPRQSPRSRGASMSMSGSAGAGATAAAARRTACGTPPLSGYAAAFAPSGQNQVGESSGMASPMQSPGARRGLKRAHSEAMEAMSLPRSAIPLSGDAAAAAAAAPAASEGARTPRVTSSAAAAAALAAPAGHKKLKISMSAGGAPMTPRGTQQQQQQQPQGYAAAAAGWPPRPSHSGGSHSAGGGPTTSAGGTPRLTLKGSTARQAQQQQQQQQQRWGKSYYSAAADDEEMGDCQTSPVRQPAAEADFLDMFEPNSLPASGEAAAGGRSTHSQQQQRQQRQQRQQQQRQPQGGAGYAGVYRQVDLSPIVGGVRGDLDAVPQFSMGAAAVLGGRPNYSDSVLGPAAAIAAAAAAAGGGNTPRQGKIRMKMTPRPSASGEAPAAAAGAAAAAAALPALPAAAAAAGGGGWPGSLTTPPNMQPHFAAAAGGDATPAAAAAAAAGPPGEATGGNHSSQGAAKSLESGGSGGGQTHTGGVSRRSTPEESCCRNSSGQGDQQHHDQQQRQGSGGSDGASHLHQQQQQAGGALQPLETSRSARLSDCAASAPPPQPPAAAAAARGAGTTPIPTAVAAGAGGDKKWKIRLRTPTPSPQLAPLKASAAFEAALRPLQLDAAAKQQQQQQRALQQQQQVGAGSVQQQQRRVVQRAVPPLQLDRLPPPVQQQPAMPQAVHGNFGQQLLQQAQQQEQQPEQYVPPVPGGNDSSSIPQIDGAADWPADLAQQAQPNWLHSYADPHAQQQQQHCSLALQWQQLQTYVLQQQAQGRSQAPAAAGDAQQQQQQQHWIPQVDGAGDELRAGCSQGPTCVLQPSPAGNGDTKQQQQQQHSKPRLQPGNGTCNGTHHIQQQQQAAPTGAVACNPAVQSSMQLQLHQQRAAAAAAGTWRSPSPADLGPFATPSTAAVAAAAAAGGDVDMADVQAAAAAEGALSRVGSSHPFASGDGAVAAAAAMLAAMVPGAPPGQQPGSRSNSPTKDHQQQQQQVTQVYATTPPPAAVAAGGLLVGSAGSLQQQQPMLPPLPTKISTWELAELPVLLQYLQEQVATDDLGGLALSDLPAGVLDPGFLLEQLEEAVAEAGAQQQEEAAAAARKVGTAAAAAAAAAHEAAQQQQPHGGARGQASQPRGLAELAREAADWQEQCGDLHPEPLRFEDLNAELTLALQTGFRVAQVPKWGEEQKQNYEHIEPVVDETDPGATQAGSYHSAGSYQSGAGTARAARGEGRGAAARPAAQQDHPGGILGGAAGAPAAAAAAAGGGGGAGVGQKRAAGAVNKQEQQERQKKAAQFKKGLGLGAKR